MIATLLALVDPGDEVIVFEPFYENYGPDTILADARPVYVPLEPGQPLDLDRLAAAFSARTRAIIVNTPNNPAGRVLTRAELDAIAGLCSGHDALAVTDEIYEHILYDGEHVPIATLPGMGERTVTISGASKTFSVTGWRVGLDHRPGRAHRRHPQGARLPHRRRAGAAAGGRGGGAGRAGRGVLRGLARAYRRRRDLLHSALVGAGFRCTPPEGAYYILADFAAVAEVAAGRARRSTTPPSRSGSPVRSG